MKALCEQRISCSNRFVLNSLKQTVKSQKEVWPGFNIGVDGMSFFPVGVGEGNRRRAMLHIISTLSLGIVEKRLCFCLKGNRTSMRRKSSWYIEKYAVLKHYLHTAMNTKQLLQWSFVTVNNCGSQVFE